MIEEGTEEGTDSAPEPAPQREPQRATGGRRKRSRPGRREQVERALLTRFFDAYAAAITAGDGPAVAALWAFPGFIISDDMARPVTSADEIERFVSGAKSHYNARGIASTKADIVRIEHATTRIVLVHVRWPHLDANEAELGEERATYTVHRTPEGELKLRIVILRGTLTRRQAAAEPQPHH